MNFKRYNESDNSWTDSHYIKGTDTDTITTLPATIYPLAQTATVGLKGNTVQNGTPSRESHVMPEGTGDMVENLFDKTSTHTSYTNTELYTITGLNPNQSYTCSTNFVADPTKAEASIYFGGDSSATNGVSSNSPKTMTANSNGEISLYLRSIQTSGSNVAVFNDVIAGTIWVMVNAGTTPVPYGYKIPISSANTTTPVYLGEVQSTRQIKKLVLTGEELWVKSSQAFYSDVIDSYAKRNSECVCTHFPYSTVNGICITTPGKMLKVYEATLPSGVTTSDELKAYLAQQYTNGTPVIVWYILATETTGIVNEQLMKIGDYADSISGISIPTIAGANTLDVQTTLKPSEVTASFNGWHPVSSAHERENGQWD